MCDPVNYSGRNEFGHILPLKASEEGLNEVGLANTAAILQKSYVASSSASLPSTLLIHGWSQHVIPGALSVPMLCVSSSAK